MAGAAAAIESGSRVAVGVIRGAGEPIGSTAAVEPAIAIGEVRDATIVGLGTGGALQLPIDPAMRISQSEIFTSPPLSLKRSNPPFVLSGVAGILPIHDQHEKK
jgi:hypothetical protein